VGTGTVDISIRIVMLRQEGENRVENSDHQRSRNREESESHHMLETALEILEKLK